MDADSFTAIDGAGRVTLTLTPTLTPTPTLTHHDPNPNQVLCWMLKLVGIGTTLKALWDVKLKFEALPLPLAS
eukprot:scaffold27223_cov63-Phaeocystis_antarctica.AAC.2